MQTKQEQCDEIDIVFFLLLFLNIGKNVLSNALASLVISLKSVRDSLKILTCSTGASKEEESNF